MIEFKEPPFSEDISIAHPDGYYLRRTDAKKDELQVIVVGPMRSTPLEISEALNHLLEKEGEDWFELESMAFLGLPSKALDETAKRTALHRGFFDLRFKRDSQNSYYSR